MLKEQQPKFIYREKLNYWELLSIISYIILTYLLFWESDIFSELAAWGAFYAYGTHLLLYLLNYKAMRKLNVWAIWFIISLVHIYIYFQVVNLNQFNMVKGNAIGGLRFTWLLLIVYQLFRFFSLKFMNIEFVALSKSHTDIWDKRRPNRFDILCFFIYFPLACLVNTWNVLY